ncbi:MAG: efflux RND transporter periplasmic adaptor subunit [Parcubacteria group bacterium]|nr:efflux RND transporter periplasmic adaptor subunit [Parcubacteria group bacterium]
MTKKAKTILIVISIVVVIVGISAVLSFIKNGNGDDVVIEEQTKVVRTIVLADGVVDGSINTVGVVSANSMVSVVSLGSGTAQSIYFNDGQYVVEGDMLVRLNNTSVEERVETAEIGLKIAIDNLNNSGIVQEKNLSDSRNSAVVSVLDYLNIVDNTLDDIDYIIKVEGDLQIEGISGTLSVKNPQSLINAKSDYLIARENNNRLQDINFDTTNIVEKLGEVTESLNKVRVVVEDMVKVLDYTIPSGSFSESALLAQQTYFNSLRASLAVTQTIADSQLRAFENVELSNKSQVDSLENLVEYSKNQLQLAQIAKDNLVIKSPIAGKITKKDIEVGDEVNINKSVAEISQTGTVKIEVSLSPEDVSFIRKGQRVTLEDNLVGVISNIASIAEWDSKKVKVDIAFNNTWNKFIPGAFVDVKIPVNKLIKTSVNSVFIPLKAVTITQGGSFVFIVEDSIAKKVEVVRGDVHGSLIEITDGLKLGDNLVVFGGKSLEDNEEVIEMAP